MDLKAIQYVQEIVRSGSMTKAAERLYLSQSALSQYISRLEKSLDTTIFRREANRLHLTPAGEIFLREGQNILSAYQHMCQHLRQANTNSNEIIRMGVSGFYGQFFLPRLFSAIKQDQLQIQLQVSPVSGDPWIRFPFAGYQRAGGLPFPDDAGGTVLHASRIPYMRRCWLQTSGRL